VSKLLAEVEGAVRDDLKRAQEDARKDLSALEVALPAMARLDKDAVERERRALLAKVDEWARSSAVLIDITVEFKEIGEAVSRAEAVAAYYGIDIPRYRQLYELGKRTLRRAAFEIPGQPPPDRTGSLTSYYQAFFNWAGIMEDVISSTRLRNQQYRMVLYKRAAFAYLRALLRSGDPLPACQAGSLGTTVRLAGRTIATRGCPDPALEELRQYVSAIRTIQSADSDAFLAESERIIGQQQLATDILSAIPMVGDGIDLYQAYAGETLSGQCMSPFERALTGLFVLITMFGPELLEMAMKRSDRVALAVENLKLGMEAWAKWGDEAMEGFAKRRGMSWDAMKSLAEFLNKPMLDFTSADLTRLKQSMSAVANPKLWDDLQANATVTRTLRDAASGRLALLSAPRELRERAIKEANQALNANLLAIQPGKAAVYKASNMVPQHAEVFERLSTQRGEILIFRSVNADARQLLELHYSTKGMNVKGKSSNWGPQRAYIPVEQKFSKLGDPERLDQALRRSGSEFADEVREIAKFHDQVSKCLKARPPCAFKMDLALPNGDRVMTVPDPRAGREMPIVMDSAGVYRNPDTRSPLVLTPGQLRDMRPLEVLAAPDAQGVLRPLTADYDFLAMGRKGSNTRPTFDTEQGWTSAADRQTIDALNQAVARDAGFGGGNVSHHGAENWYPNSPGAMVVDDVVTVFDPQLGALSIPRCDFACMERWCKTSGACAGVPVCSPGVAARQPCIPVDPDRLLKEYFHARRLEGWDLTPNSAWDWGAYNPLGGWTLDRFLAHPGAQPFVQASQSARVLARRAIALGSHLVNTVFSCGDQAATPAAGDAR